MPSPRPLLRRFVRRLSPRSLRNWLRSPRASFRWALAAWRWRRRGAAELDCGQSLRLHCHPDSARTFRAFLDDAACVAEFAEFRALAREGMVLYDLGAHYGFFSLAALALGGNAARAVAVEPSPRAFEVLRANLHLAGAPGRFRAVHAAVGPEDGRLAMIAGGVASENYMFAAEPGRPDAVAIPQYSLAGLEALTDWVPTHVKVDIEGFEFEFLTSADNLAALKRWRPVLLLELHSELMRARGRRPESVVAALAGIGYRVPEFDRSAPLLRLALPWASAAAGR